MPGPAVTIVPQGGLPVRAVTRDAPVLTAVERGGFAITLSERGAPFIVEGATGGFSVTSGDQAITINSMPAVPMPLYTAGNGQITVTGYA